MDRIEPERRTLHMERQAGGDLVAADRKPADIQGRASLGRDDRHPQCLAGNRLWAARAVFAVGVDETCGSFVEVKKPEHALKLFIRFALAKGAVTYGLELMLAVFSIVQGMVSTIITQSGSSG